MAAHDAVIAARTGQVIQANKHRRPATFREGDFVYLSTKNIAVPTGRARKLVPKFLGPFRVSKVLSEGATYELELSEELRTRGIHNAFHASLLRPHYPNDDRRFPGRQFHQIPGFGEQPREWAVDRILSHVGAGRNAEFEVQWTTGDVSWAPYHDVQHLQVLSEYLEALGVSGVRQLRDNRPTPASSLDRTLSNDTERHSGGAKLDTPPLTSDAVRTSLEPSVDLSGPPTPLRAAMAHLLIKTEAVRTVDAETIPSASTAHLPTMSAVPNHYNAADRVAWERYAEALQAYGAARGPHPGEPPAGYREVFKLSQRFAPVPEDFPPPVPAPSAQSAVPAGVNMSDGAFNALLAHTASVHAQVVALQAQVLSGTSHRDATRFSAAHGRGGGPSYARRGRKLAGMHLPSLNSAPMPCSHSPPLKDRVSARFHPSDSSHRPKRKRGNRGGQGRRQGQSQEAAQGQGGAAAAQAAPASAGMSDSSDFLQSLVDAMALMFYGTDPPEDVPSTEPEIEDHSAAVAGGDDDAMAVQLGEDDEMLIF